MKVYMSKELIRLSITNQQGVYFDANDDGMFSLTKIWQHLGNGDSNKKAHKWLRTKETKAFIGALGVALKPLQVSRGHGTWAAQQVALAYMTWISPEAQIAVNQIVIERMEENANPELAIQRARERAALAYKREGKSDAWIAERLRGVDIRNLFTEELGSRGVRDWGYGACTNAIYEPLLGGKTDELKARRELTRSDSLRDNLTRRECSFVRFAEELATMKMEQDDARGNNKCRKTCEKAGRLTKEAITNMMTS
jgi:hypothetical protein